MGWNLERLEKHLLVGSTLVEGSTLSEQEANQVLAGRTVAGHFVHEVRELLNYRSAVAWLITELEEVPYVSEDLVLRYHRLLFAGLPHSGGCYKTSANFTYRTDGSKHFFEKPYRVRTAMRGWLGEYNSKVFASAQEGAASLYYAFVDIHPFEDGNGRIGRVFIAYWLQWKWRREWSFYLKDKHAHLDALQKANGGDLNDLVRFFGLRLKEEG